MPELNKLTVLQKQKNTKPEIDGFITKYLDENLKCIALDFVTWLRENKMQPRWGSSINTWTSTYKGKAICRIEIEMFNKPGSGIHRGYTDNRPGGLPCLVIKPFLNNKEAYRDLIMSEGLQDIVWDNANACVYSERSPSFGMAKAPGCSPSKPCAPGGDVTVLGKTIKYNCCGHFLISIWNPDETTINGVKRLLTLEQNARAK